MAKKKAAAKKRKEHSIQICSDWEIQGRHVTARPKHGEVGKIDGKKHVYAGNDRTLEFDVAEKIDVESQNELNEYVQFAVARLLARDALEDVRRTWERRMSERGLR